VDCYDAIVIGTGFGGLGAAMGLVESGAKIALLEALNYPGGCASTFTRRGYAFEAGATLFSGFGEGQLMRRWIDTYGLPVDVDWLDPLIELRTPDWKLDISSNRDELVENFSKLPGASKPKLARFFEKQKNVADTLWALFDDPDLLPPITVRSLMTHVARSPKYLPLLGLMGKSMQKVVQQSGLQDFEPLRVYLDALCQITVQVPSDNAEAPFAMAATDYCFRGTGHVAGGIGVLTTALCDHIARSGSDVMFSTRAKSLEYSDKSWTVQTRNGPIRAPIVMANLLPQNMQKLLQAPSRDAVKTLDAGAKRVQKGWGAAMMYLAVENDAIDSPSAHHYELVADPNKPFIAGNHIFCSVSDTRETHRAPDGQRTMTVSTHVPMSELLSYPDEEKGEYIESIQNRMKETLSSLMPQVVEKTRFEMTASPRTFERFTRRAFGYVGGIPRRVGLQNYQGMFPRALMNGLYTVGDSGFPGQSTLATAIGGLRTAEAAMS